MLLDYEQKIINLLSGFKMSLIITLSIVFGCSFGICSIIWLIEWMYDRRVEKRKNAIRHYRWLSSRGLYESAYIVDPGYTC